MKRPYLDADASSWSNRYGPDSLVRDGDDVTLYAARNDLLHFRQTSIKMTNVSCFTTYEVEWRFCERTNERTCDLVNHGLRTLGMRKVPCEKMYTYILWHRFEIPGEVGFLAKWHQMFLNLS